jgi:hypothetical protein
VGKSFKHDVAASARRRQQVSSARIRRLRGTGPFQHARLKSSQVTPHPARFPMKCIGTAGHPLPRERAGTKNTSDGCPLPWGEGGDPAVAGEPGEGVLSLPVRGTPVQLTGSDSRCNPHIPPATYHLPLSAIHCTFCTSGLKALTLFRSLCYGQMFVLAVIFFVDTKEGLRVWAEATSSLYL